LERVKLDFTDWSLLPRRRRRLLRRLSSPLPMFFSLRRKGRAGQGEAGGGERGGEKGYTDERRRDTREVREREREREATAVCSVRSPIGSGSGIVL
jgi:hypothetical protein